MTLQFDSSPYLEAFRAKQQRTPTGSQIAGQINQGVSSLGDTATKLAQIPQMQRQQRLQQLMAGVQLQNAGIDPSAGLAWANTGRFNNNNPSQPPPMSQPSPMTPPPQGLPNPNNPVQTGPQLASAGVGDYEREFETPQAMPSPITKSPIIEAWNKSRGGQTPQPSGFQSLFQQPDVSNVKFGSPEYYKLPPKRQQMVKDVSEFNQKEEDKKLQRETLTAYQQASLDQGKLRAELTHGEKSDQFYQKEWDKIVKQTDPLTATSRSTLGLATRADYNANRALTTLSKPTVTNQEAGNVMADIASIYQNGTATQFGMSHQAYDTLYGKIQGALQMTSGKPQDALPNAIKERLISVLQDMKGTNKAVLKQAFDSIEMSQPNVISHYQDEWKNLRKNYEGGIAGGPGEKPLYATNGKQRIMSTDGGQTWQPAQ